MREIHSRSGNVISRAQLADIILHVVGGKQNFSYHTDRISLARDASRLDGCSHCRLLASQPGLFAPYALDASETDALHSTLTWLESVHVKPDTLRGNHDECAVLIVQNVHSLARCEPLTAAEVRRARRLWVLDNYAVLRGAGRKRAFVFQRDLARARIDALAVGLATSLPPNAGTLTDMVDLLDRIAQVHFTRTLKHLAPHLPFYNLFIDAHTDGVGEPERLIPDPVPAAFSARVRCPCRDPFPQVLPLAANLPWSANGSPGHGRADIVFFPPQWMIRTPSGRPAIGPGRSTSVGAGCPVSSVRH
jgi:hypothetical protein